MLVEIPPHVSVADVVRQAKGRSSRKIQQEFEHIRKRYRGRRIWKRGPASEEHSARGGHRRATPRSLLGNSGSIMHRSRSVRSYIGSCQR